MYWLVCHPFGLWANYKLLPEVYAALRPPATFWQPCELQELNARKPTEPSKACPGDPIVGAMSPANHIRADIKTERDLRRSTRQ